MELALAAGGARVAAKCLGTSRSKRGAILGGTKAVPSPLGLVPAAAIVVAQVRVVNLRQIWLASSLRCRTHYNRALPLLLVLLPMIMKEEEKEGTGRKFKRERAL